MGSVMGEDAPGTIGGTSSDEDEFDDQPFINLQNDAANGNAISVKDDNLLSPKGSDNNGF